MLCRESHREEGSIATVEEGAVDHLQDEGGVQQLDDRNGGTQEKAQAQQGRQGQRRHRGAESCGLGGGAWFRGEERCLELSPRERRKSQERS